MNYPEYAEKIKNIPYPAKLEYHIAVMWLHPERLPLGVVSLGDAILPIVKIPHEAVNNAYDLGCYYTVPVIALGKNLFRGREDITDIVLPSTIQWLSEKAFAGCSNLRRITIPKNIRYCSRFCTSTTCRRSAASIFRSCRCWSVPGFWRACAKIRLDHRVGQSYQNSSP